MQQQNGTKADATLNTQSHANETDKQDYLTEEKDIPNTPFKLRRLNQKWFTTMGDQRLTEPTNTQEEQIQILENSSYNIILNMIVYSFNRLKMHDELAKATPYETESL